MAIAANDVTIHQGPYGASFFGPVVDGLFVLQLPDQLLAQGRRARNIRPVMGNHNPNEGLIFTNPATQNNSAFDASIETTLPDIQSYVADMVIELYPDIFDNQTGLGYNDSFSRATTLMSDLIVTCNMNALLESFSANQTYSCLFGEGGGLHGADTDYVFYTGPAEESYGLGPVNETLAFQMQNGL